MLTDEGRKLYQIIDDLLTSKLDTLSFCSDFESYFNFQTAREDLSSVEIKVFSELFDRIVWYSPYPEEIKEIPNYIGDKQVREAVHQAVRQLQEEGLVESKSL